MQTQTSNTLHNAIMEAGSKDRPPMLAPGNYVQWKFRIKRYINTKPNHELIHCCLENPPYELGVIPSTSVSRPQLKSNPMGDRVLRNNSRGKKQEVEDHCRNVKLPKNKTFVTACNDSLNAKTLNVKSVSMCDKYMLHDKHDMCVLTSVAKPIKRTVASELNKKPRNFTRKIYEHFNKTCSWWYPKFTPSGYIWKPKSRTENVNSNVSMPLGNNSRIANILDTMTP
nr:hypothetical protein [Tanacetum cinerariifolium]